MAKHKKYTYTAILSLQAQTEIGFLVQSILLFNS